ncbi:MAG: ComF family protein [Planctomycetaceae bacterium]|nr:ComF family protein [Planctomycetaceae bacterium]
MWEKDFWQQVPGLVVSEVVDLLFPARCLLCEQALDQPFHVPLYCVSCREQITPPLEGTCYRCGIRLPFRVDGEHGVPLVNRSQTRQGCPDCRRKKWAFDRTVAVASYEGRWREHVYRLKRPHHSADAFQAGKLLGERLIECEWWSEYHALVPLPVHWRRRWTRGFNQAEKIAEGIATVIPMPIITGAIVANKYARKQGTLVASARLANVQNSMKLGPRAAELRQQQVILVDDVLTTGSTANVAARLCRQAGARRVAVAVVARAGRF